MDTSDISGMEDDVESEILARVRLQRAAEMKARANKEFFGDVLSISEPEFVKEVTEASKEFVCVLHLFVYGKDE